MRCEVCGGDGTGAAVLVRGRKAVEGCVRGVARVLRTPRETDLLGEGEVLVTTMTNPEATPAILRARAVVTDRGGALCHAAIVAREYGVPCVVGTGVATDAVRDGTLVIVCANNGCVVSAE